MKKLKKLKQKSSHFTKNKSKMKKPLLKLSTSVKQNAGKPKKLSDVVNLKLFPKKSGVEENVTKMVYAPKYTDRVPIPPEKLKYHSRGEGVQHTGVITQFHSKKLLKQDRKIEFSKEEAARSELLLPEETGYLCVDKGEVTTQFTQKQIVAAVDITSATKHFDLILNEFGPYRLNYSQNGRYLLLGGRKGHVAAFDWITKKLLCEVNVMDSVYDIQWLHMETMFAVAQKDWVYIYDNDGIELHCIKGLSKVLRMEFLPYHFLLATANEEGYLTWLDVSQGKIISRFNSRMGRLNIMAQNPYNAILCLGHAKGVVTMWSPNVRKPVAKMLCHAHPLQALAVDMQGKYMATACVDRSLKIWDIRQLNAPLQDYHLRAAPNSIAFSQKEVLAVGMGNMVEVYANCIKQTVDRPYLRHKMVKTIGNLEFSAFEDVLGVATAGGFTSLLVPGSGEPNYDALERNPFQNKMQRREAEVKALLEKIQPEMICLDPDVIIDVDIPTLQDKMEAVNKLAYMKPPEIDFTPRERTGRRKGSAHTLKVKKIANELHRREFVKNLKEIDTEAILSEGKEKEKSSGKELTSVLDRFKPVIKKKNTT